MEKFFTQEGIIDQTSCINTPQQNDTVERKHQHFINIARSLKFQFQIPLCFWNFCVLHVTKLINVLPSPYLHGSKDSLQPI